MSYIREFDTEAEADTHMRAKNAPHRNLRPGIVFCLVAGPEDNFAVVDLGSAVELETPYRWSM